ncbi:MAG: toll/interleukin-1 receptor domain-containing protein [Spiroplasma sp.]|nr:toll/interleukin-1 receptor domain-containing protein [Spiroplasma sp.]
MKNNTVFFSHNSKDKVIVEPIALKLMEIFGKDVIFYDSWSIQPGEKIFKKMEEGLNSCKFFFLFISNNSLESQMVELELHAALNKLTSKNKEITIITIRLENIKEMPLFLQNIKWIDFFTLGFDATVRTIYDIIMGNNVFHPKFKTIRNLKAYLNIIDENNAEVTVEASHFLEPNSEIGIWWRNEKKLEATLIGEGFQETGTVNESLLNNKVPFKILTLKGRSNLYPNNPIKIKVKTEFNLHENSILIYHRKNKGLLELIETTLTSDPNKINYKNEIIANTKYHIEY